MIQHFNKNMETNYYTWDTTLEKRRGSVQSLI